MVKLTASNNRPGAFGDSVKVELDDEQSAHIVANWLNCGLYTIDDGEYAYIWEWDGTNEPYVIDSYPSPQPAMGSGSGVVWL